MAKTRMPDPLSRRHLIARDLAAGTALQYAEAYLEAGRSLEAIGFLAKADAEGQLADVRRSAIADGDAFLLRAAASAQGEPARRDEWLKLAEAATAAGKERYADEARRFAEREG